ncbi:MAG: beta-lactamase-like [Novosphingobium sp.]|nr:beta-lactamase-like [Novosphingobium sp.]
MNRNHLPFLRVLASGLALLLAAPSSAQDAPLTVVSAPPADLATACNGRDGWADPAPPARIFGDTWFVGTCGISVVLITSDQGHILIDGGPVAAAPLVAANIEKLGFRLKDIRWIVSSHEHDDHVGALAELKRLTGARVAALDTAAPQLRAGKPAADDPQSADLHDFPPIVVDRLLNDREDFRFGSLQITVRSTPAHTAGSASWTWSACDVTRCQTIAYADSATVISAKGYRFSDHGDRVRAAREGLKRIGELPCDILVTPHPGASDLFARISARKPLAEPEACHKYAAAAEERLTARLAQEESAPETAK